MQRFAVLLPIGLLIAACTPDGDVTGTTNSCIAKLYSSYNRMIFDQCVAACTQCERGTTTTCTTSCTLRGAR
jgi:hypothetical protein